MLISKLFYRHFLFTIMSTAIEIVAISFIVGRMLCCLWVFTQKVKSIELILTWNCKTLRQSGYKWFFCWRYSQELFFLLLFSFVVLIYFLFTETSVKLVFDDFEPKHTACALFLPPCGSWHCQVHLMNAGILPDSYRDGDLKKSTKIVIIDR